MKNTMLNLCLVLVLTRTAFSWTYTPSSTWATQCTASGTQQSPASFSGAIGCGYYQNLALNLPSGTFNMQYSSIYQNYQWLAGGNGGSLYADSNTITPFFPTSVQDNYQLNSFVFHAPAEHTMPGQGTAQLELQLFFFDANNNQATVSVLFNGSANTWQQDPARQTIALDSMPTTVTPTAFNLADLVPRMNNNPNWIVYNGTTTSLGDCNNTIWYIYAPVIYTNPVNIQNFGKLVQAAITTNAMPSNVVGGTTGNVRTPTPLTNSAVRFCWAGYYQLSIPWNYGLWWAVVITVIYFVVTLYLDESPIEDAHYKTNPWSHHPLYSIFKISNNFFTAKSRTSLLWINLINICLFSAVFYAQMWVGNMADIFLFGLYACLIGIGCTYIHGFFLRLYYENKKLSIAAAAEKDQEVYEDRAQRYLFIFYFWTFLWMWGGNVLFVWQMFALHAEQSSTTSNWWVLSFFIAVALDWVIFDPICCVLASIPAFRKFFQWKGYIYDEEVCHWSYKHQKKVL
jgi:hypothetical protein